MQKNDRKREDRNRRPRKNERDRENKAPKVDMSVWEILRPFTIQAQKNWEKNFAFPQFKNEKDRMKQTRQKYENTPLGQAMADFHGIKSDIVEINPEIGNTTPSEVRLGQLVDLGIRNVDKKDGVVFDSGVYKENFITRNNLGAYKKFQDFTYNGTIKGRVIEKTKDRAVVDIFTPMIEEFILPRASRPWIQNQIHDQVPVIVKNLRLMSHGYIGDAVIPNISEWLGAEYTIPCFIPGSQIELNTTENFEEWIGKDVPTHITSYSLNARPGAAPLVCSRKAHIRHQGNLNLKALFSWWCDDDEKWADFIKHPYAGQVTGVINSSKKCGIFVEIPLLNVTGMIPMDADRLVEYPAGKWIDVRFKTFEEETEFNSDVQQVQRKQPFVIEEGAIKEVNVKPIFEIA